MKFLMLAVLLSACGWQGMRSPADDVLDSGGIDTDPGPDGPCGVGRPFTGALLDLDSATPVAAIANAMLSVPGVSTTTTDPEGRFEMCIPTTQVTTVDLALPAGYGEATLTFRDASTPLRPIRPRAFTVARAQTFYAELGLTYDPTRAHVLVHNIGDGVELSLDREHGAPHGAVDPDSDATFTWSPGSGGSYVLFPNVDVSEPTGRLGNGIGGSVEVPLEPGTLTIALYFFVFL